MSAVNRRKWGLFLCTFCIMSIAGLFLCTQDNHVFKPEVDQEAFPGAIKGQIFDKHGKDGIAGVIISDSLGGVGVTGPDGRFTMSNITPVTHVLHAYKEGYMDTTLAPVTVALNKTVLVPSVKIRKSTASISGLVVDSQGVQYSNQSLIGVMIRNTSVTGIAMAGEFTLAKVDTGSKNVIAVVQDVGYGSLPITVLPDTDYVSRVVVVRFQGGTVTGRIVDETNKPVSGAHVVIMDRVLEDTTTADGRYTINRVPNEGMQMRVSYVSKTSADTLKLTVNNINPPEKGSVDLGSQVISSVTFDSSLAVRIYPTSMQVIQYDTAITLSVPAPVHETDVTLRSYAWIVGKDTLLPTSQPMIVIPAKYKFADTLNPPPVKVRAMGVRPILDTTGTGKSRLDTTYSNWATIYVYVKQTIRRKVRTKISTDTTVSGGTISPDSAFARDSGSIMFTIHTKPGFKLATVIAVDSGNTTGTTDTLAIVRTATDTTVTLANITKSRIVTAFFNKNSGGNTVKKFTLSALSNDTALGTISPASVSVDSGTSKTFAISIKNGNRIDSLKVGTVKQSVGTSDVSFTIANVVKGDTVRIWFSRSSVVSPAGTLIDIDGNTYHTVIIGTQEWTVENLKVTKLNDGTAIPLDTSVSSWTNRKTPASCYYANNPTNGNLYGLLYNSFAISTGKLAPSGWRVPDTSDWKTLQNYCIANGYNWDGSTSGSKIAASLSSKTGWPSHTTPGTPGFTPQLDNRTGFSAIPGGYRDLSGGFGWGGQSGNWWSATLQGSFYAYYMEISFESPDIILTTAYKNAGYSVRLVRGNSVVSTTKYKLSTKVNDTTLGTITPIWSMIDSATGSVTFQFKVKNGGKFDSLRIGSTRVTTGIVGDSLYTVSQIVKNDSVGIFFSKSPSQITYSDSIKLNDGLWYHTIQIGNQVWMAENLRTTVLNDQSAIPVVTDTTAWRAGATPACCYYKNDTNYAKTYGPLYNWKAARSDKLAPTGWRLPADSDFIALRTYLGTTNAGGAMKEAGLTHWSAPNTGATNSSKFSGLPAGSRDYSGYSALNSAGFFWCVNDTGGASYYYLSTGTTTLDLGYVPYFAGFSVRLIKN